MITLIKNVHILTMDEKNTVIKHGYVFFSEETILALGTMENLSNEQMIADCTIDGKSGLLLPGFINTHTHLGMIPFRSLGDDVPDRLRRFLFPLEQYMTRELVRASSEYAIAEMLLSGVTAFCDMYYFENEVAKACEKMAVRALVGETIIDLPKCDSPEPMGGYIHCETLLQQWQKHPLITPMIAPHAPNTVSGEMLKKIVCLSEKYHAPITMHVAEMTYEMTELEQKYQQTPVEYLENLGYFSREFILAHCLLVNEKNLAIIAQSKEKARVAHCIGANTKSAKGIAPVKQMLAQEIIVGLGTDGPSSGNTLDMFSQMRLFANFHKTYNQDRACFKAQEIVRLATIEGAKTLGLADKVGSIEVGKQADITLVETSAMNMFPIYDPYAVLVYSANASNVEAVWIKGKQLVKNKQLVGHDVNQLRSTLYQAMTPFVQEAQKRR